MEQNLKQLDGLFYPRSVAFIGATEARGKWGNIIFNNLIAGGYAGKIYPVNRSRPSVFGYKAYPFVEEIPEQVDMAVFTIPAKHVVSGIESCAAKGIKAAVVISAGFKELGGESAALEEELVSKARAGKMRVVGPNGQGVCCPKSNLYSWMPGFFPAPGKIGVISQSGNIQGLLIEAVDEAGFGISKTVSSGNEADLKTEDYVAYLSEDLETEVILVYLEGVSDNRRFYNRTRAASFKKPIVALRGGRTRSGASAATSHTGAMAVSSTIFDSACRQMGIIRARNITDAAMLASSFLGRPLPKGRRVGILTGGGGLGVLAADMCTELGLQVADFSKETLTKIGALMPNWWVPGNPVDMVAGLNFDSFIPTLEIMLGSGEIDSLIVMFIPPWGGVGPCSKAGNEAAAKVIKAAKFMTQLIEGLNEILFDLMQKYDLPIFSVGNLHKRVKKEDSIIPVHKRVTIFPNIESACRATKAMAAYADFKMRSA